MEKMSDSAPLYALLILMSGVAVIGGAIAFVIRLFA